MNVTIEKISVSDAAEILEYLKKIGEESDNLSFGAEGLPCVVEDEEKYIESLQNSTSCAQFVAKCDGKIIGDVSFNSSPKERIKHRGEIGIAVVREYWGKGIGSKLMEAVIDFAKNTAGCEIIHLQVRSDNERAIKLYKKYGFEKIGQFRGFLKINGEYVDCDLMNLYIT
ncbi:MAG: GNAT family N-acetyltransferase [Clostridia bacterium]